MVDEKNEPSGFKVVDRRPFTPEGSRRADAPAEVNKDEPSPRPAPKPSSPRAAEIPEEEFRDEPSGFETLVSYLSTTAMFQLGLMAGPGGERIPPDFENAHRTIDMLAVLQEKTRGNLTAPEIRLLEEVLYELRMTFVEMQKRQARKA